MGEVQALTAAARHPWAENPAFSELQGAVSRLYESTPGSLLWLAADGPTPAARHAIAALLDAPAEGLADRDYDTALLGSLADRLGALRREDQARFDVLLTVDLLRYLHDVQYGRVRDRPVQGKAAPSERDQVALVSAVLAGDSLPALVRGIEPQPAQYRLLRAALARYRAVAGDTTLGGLPPGRFIWPGYTYEFLPRLARTLIALGDLAPDSAPSGQAYDGPVVAAVRRFQRRHALSPDGVLGPETLAALNAPVAGRVQAIELALERLRWLPPIGDGRLLVVNIPAFQVMGFESATAAVPPTVSLRAVVGRAMGMRTPLLFERLRAVEFLPYWNVPSSILHREILPALEWSPDFLRAHDMEIVDRRGRVLGDSVTPALLRGLQRDQLRVRQRPGPGNALGAVKFIFPNRESVFLHDTPRKERFEEAVRDFSHGCIGVEDPAALAAWVLRGHRGWSRAEIDAALSGTKTRRIVLDEPMPVLVYYMTTVARADGSVWFYPDVYGYDRELIEALQTGPRLSAR